MKPASSDQELKDAIARNERLALWGAGGVVFGLLLEILFAAAFHEPPETLLSHWGPVGADAIVALGVAAEVWFGRKSRIDSEELTRRSEERLAQANTRAAEAIERAAAAELETERLRKEVSWRRLSKEQAAILTGILNQSPKYSLRVYHLTNDPESTTYAYDIGEVFKNAGWKVLYTSATFHGITPLGVNIPLWPPPNMEVCGFVITAVLNSSIECFSGPFPPPMMTSTLGDTVTEPMADIFVGAKPSAAMPGPETIQTQIANNAKRESNI